MKSLHVLREETTVDPVIDDETVNLLKEGDEVTLLREHI